MITNTIERGRRRLLLGLGALVALELGLWIWRLLRIEEEGFPKSQTGRLCLTASLAYAAYDGSRGWTWLLQAFLALGAALAVYGATTTGGIVAVALGGFAVYCAWCVWMLSSAPVFAFQSLQRGELPEDDERDSGGSSIPAESTPLVRRPSLHLVTKPARSPDSRSAFGGSPPAGEAFEWPHKDGRPLSYLGCLDLEEVAETQAIEWLPERGRLLVFYDLQEMPWGYEPEHAGSWAILLQGVEAEVVTAAPEGTGPSSERRALELRALDLAPDHIHLASGPQDLDEDEFESLEKAREEAFADAPRHQLGGYPDPIQNAELEMECEEMSGASDSATPPHAELLRRASSWRLLLQIDSDDDLGWMWGDAGMLYFLVREDEARRGDFSKVWLILQCY